MDGMGLFKKSRANLNQHETDGDWTFQGGLSGQIVVTLDVGRGDGGRQNAPKWVFFRVQRGCNPAHLCGDYFINHFKDSLLNSHG